MIFAITANAKTPCFDGGETKSDSFSESCGIDMGNLVLVADPAV